MLEGGRSVRLLNAYGYNQDVDTQIEIGDVYDITFGDRSNIKPPHVEDILVHSWRKLRNIYRSEMVDILRKSKVKIWKGGKSVLFDGKLKQTNSGKCYINADAIPECSTGLWIPNRDLALEKDQFGKDRYFQKFVSLPYVGFEKSIEKIPAGTLIRVSLARWWSPSDSENEERCYLQLSGWY